MVIFLFLRNLSATIIPSVAVPLSLVGTFAAMYALGYSLDNLSLMALTISTGFVVDDAIVMIENISRYLEEGDAPMEAALKGAEQIGFTILSLTVSLIAVLIPLLFMGDVVGRLFREFAVTLAVTIIISAVVSLTLTPMMCCAHPAAQARGAAGALLSRLGTRLRAHDRVLRPHAEVSFCAIRRSRCWSRWRTLVLTVFLYIMIPKGFFPVQDTGVIQGISQAPQSISFARHGGEAAGTGQGDSAGSGGGEPFVVHRRGRHQYDAEQRPHVDQPQAARRARAQRVGRDPPAADEARAGAGHHAVHAAGAGHHGR